MADALNDLQQIERTDVPALRKTLRKLGVVVAEVDRELRYVWIDNPHPDFDARAVVGKRDDELLGKADAAEIMALKREVFRTEEPSSRLIEFKRSDGPRHYNISAYPVCSAQGVVDAVITFGFEARVPSPRPPADRAR